MMDLTALVAAAPLPPGYSLEVRPQRVHRLRCLWAVRVLDADGRRLFGRAYYNVAAGIVEAQRWTWEQAGVPA